MEVSETKDLGLLDYLDDPKKINKQVAGLVVKPLKDLSKDCEKFNVAIGIIATLVNMHKLLQMS